LLAGLGASSCVMGLVFWGTARSAGQFVVGALAIFLGGVLGIVAIACLVVSVMRRRGRAKA
jgi:hypothetical protein